MTIQRIPLNNALSSLSDAQGLWKILGPYVSAGLIALCFTSLIWIHTTIAFVSRIVH